MKKFIYLSIILLTTTFNFAQKKYSLEFNYGLISPMVRTSGLQGIGKMNYQLNKTIRLFTSISYGVWGAEYANYKTLPDRFKKLLFTDNHKMVPLNFGADFLLKESKFLSLFAIGELGFSYLTYRQYNYNSYIDTETNEVNYLLANNQTQNESDFLFGFGLGLGGLHRISTNTELLLKIKINTNYTTKTNKMFTTNNTYTSLTMGFNYYL